MKLVHAERNGEAFDSQLVIGVRESYVNLCSSSEDKHKIYKENFERAYIQATEAFYKVSDFTIRMLDCQAGLQIRMVK